MATPDNLSGTDEIESSDLLAVWSSRNRDSRRVSYGQFRDAIADSVENDMIIAVESANASAEIAQTAAETAAGTVAVAVDELRGEIDQTVANALAIPLETAVSAAALAQAASETSVTSAAAAANALADAAKKSDLLADSGGANVNIKQPWVGGFIRSLFARAQDKVSIKDFGAVGDGTIHYLSESFASLAAAQAVFPFVSDINTQTRDWAATQAAVNYVRQRGWLRRLGIVGSQQGGKVHIPSGCYVLNEPVILPRSGLYDGSAVGLVGEMMTSSVLVGSESFPANRGMIEWEAVASRAYYQLLEELTFILPRTVVGVNAVKFTPVDRSTTALIFKEAMHGLCMRRIEVDASNTVNAHAIKFDGYVRHSQFDVIRANFARGATPTYNTVLLQFPEDIGTDSSIYGESNGVAYSTFTSLLGMGEQGGGGALLRGRLYECVLQQLLCGNGTLNSEPSIALINSLANRICQINVEGGNAQLPGQLYLKNSDGNTITEIGMGAPNPGVASVGIFLENSDDNHFEGRYTDPSTPAFSLWSGKFLKIDANSRRNTLRRMYLNADVSTEVEVLAPASAMNCIEYIYPSSGVKGETGLRPGFVLAMAQTNAAQSLPTGTFTRLIFGNETRDPLGVYNPATGAITVPVSGVYRITYTAYVTGVTATSQIEVAVSINGGINAYTERPPTGSESFRNLRGDIVVNLTAGLLVGIGVTHSTGSPLTMTATGLSATISFEYLG